MNSFNYDSWQVKAFAEDAAGPLGGCFWPPRSYSCSFCKREFRSAQALGGHMNVHRRDRARLKLSLSPHSEVLQHLDHNPNHCKSLDYQLPSAICTLDHNLDPNSSSSIVASTLSTSRVSALTTQENHSEHTFMYPYSPIFQEQHKGFPSTYTTPSWSDSVAVKLLDIPDSKPEIEKDLREEGSISLRHDDYIETGLSVGLNSMVCPNRPIGYCGDGSISSKRPKTGVSTLPLILKQPCSNDRDPLQQEVIGLKPSFMEDLDLELRLGDPPKVK